MLLPHKHSHPDQTVLAAAAAILRALRRHRAMTYDELKDAASGRVLDIDYLFTPAVSLLHLLGLVEYRSTVDTFEYLGN